MEDIDADLAPDKTAVIVVDMKNDFIEEGAPLETPMGRAFVDESDELLDVSCDAGAMVIYMTHMH